MENSPRDPSPSGDQDQPFDDGDETVRLSPDRGDRDLGLELVEQGEGRKDQEQEEQDLETEDPDLPTQFPLSSRYRQLLQEQDAVSDSGSAEGLPRRVGSPIGSLLSAQEDDGGQSVQDSTMSSPAGSSILPSAAVAGSSSRRSRLGSPTPSFRPFDRRFQSRISTPSNLTPRPSSPAYLLGHSRTVSVASQMIFDPADTDSTPPWEVVRWTKLNKLNGQAFSEAGKRNFGSPTCMAVSTSLVLGTSKGIILIFDYNQNLKLIVGPGTKAVESGAVTAIAISADHTTIAAGHANGSIFTWDTTRPSRPFLQIPHLEPSQLENRTTDGHLPSVVVAHIGFLGKRHTALVSADDRGMAFSHLATRGTGALGRTVKTARILGRYPNAPLPSSGKPLKASTVLAFSPLPLGNVECATDALGLTAMLTPYLLVIVSTTPVAQTQHKSARPKDVVPHSALSGCLAWFPAVRLKAPDPTTESIVSRAKLVYCWSNVLTVLDVNEIPSEDKDKPPVLQFKARSRWQCEEPIVAVQWLTRSVLTILTISQRLIVLEDHSMRMTEAFDLIHKHIYHVDLFSKQLHDLVERLDDDDHSMHGVVADAFYMSLKSFQGRMFLLGFNDVSIGALSNWADRLIALMENGDYVGAIQLATSYYTGDTNKLTVGLPEDAELRHQTVRDKLMEIMGASLKHTFGERNKKSSTAVNDETLQRLAETCFIACQSIGDDEFLFDDMYEWYEEAGVQGIFLEPLEPYILERSITTIPPTVIKTLVTHFVSKGWESRLEEAICHMETATLDIDQITSLCKQYSLYDALIYVWNQALHDYITPLMDLLTLLIPLMHNGDFAAEGRNQMQDENVAVNALKIFPYLSYTLTGRIYPSNEPMDDAHASQAKAELYWFLFSGKSIAWPRSSTSPFRTRPAHTNQQEPSFPYLRMILKLDAPSFLSALNEAFEDPFLNEAQEKPLNGGQRRDLPEEQTFGLTVDRQYVVSILVEIMLNPGDFAAEDTVYLDMFIARNLPKFPQYLLLPESTLSKVVVGLCHYPGPDLADDAQLSTEYLLSVYTPPDLVAMMPLFKQAGFYRILKRTYKTDRQFAKLIQTYFEDPRDREEVFDCISECLAKPGLAKKQVNEIHDVVKQHSHDLVLLNPSQTAQTIARRAPDLHAFVLSSLPEGSGLQFEYLRTLLEPTETQRKEDYGLDRDFVEMYVQLMCKYEPAHVSDYVGRVQSAADLRLEKLLPAMEETGVIDAAVLLMAREGLVKDAMDRLAKHLCTLEGALQGLLSSSGSATMETGMGERGRQDAAEELLRSLQKYTHVGIWLCQGQMKTMAMASRKTAQSARKPGVAGKSGKDAELATDELLWLSLIDTTVQITRRLSSVVASLPTTASSASKLPSDLDTDRLITLLRSLVQHTFTALLTATTSVPSPTSSITTTTTTTTNDPATNPNPNSNPSPKPISTPSSPAFLRIMRAFLTTAAAASPTLADLRAVLASIFAAYAYEEAMLALSRRLLEQQLFLDVGEALRLRQRGWRPRGGTCEACGRRVWGPGVPGGSAVWEAWEERRLGEQRRRMVRGRIGRLGEDGRGKGKGKGKGVDYSGGGENADADGDGDGGAEEGRVQVQAQAQGPGPLVVLACRHVYHQGCLDAVLAREGDGGGGGGADRGHRRRRTVDEFGRERWYRCPIDG